MALDSILSSPFDPSTNEKDAKILQFIEEITQNVDVIRQNVLNDILTQNFQIKYHQNLKSNIRIVTYEDLQVKIEHRKYDPDPIPSQRRLAVMPKKIREKWDYRRK